MIDKTKVRSLDDFSGDLASARAGARAGAPEMRPGNVSLAQRRALERHGLAQQEQGQSVRTPAELSEIEKHKQYMDQIRTRMEAKKKEAETKPLGDIPPINIVKPEVKNGLDDVQSGTRELSFGDDTPVVPITEEPKPAEEPESLATDPRVLAADQPLTEMADQVADAPDTGEGILPATVPAEKPETVASSPVPAAISTAAAETVPLVAVPAVEPQISPAVEQAKPIAAPESGIIPGATETITASEPEETVAEAEKVVQSAAPATPLTPNEMAAPLADDTTGSTAPPTQDTVTKREGWLSKLLGRGKKPGGPTAAEVNAVEKSMTD